MDHTFPGSGSNTMSAHVDLSKYWQTYQEYISVQPLTENILLTDLSSKNYYIPT